MAIKFCLSRINIQYISEDINNSQLYHNLHRSRNVTHLHSLKICKDYEGDGDGKQFQQHLQCSESIHMLK